MSAIDCPFRAVQDRERGIEFEIYLSQRVQSLGLTPQRSRELTRRLWAFIQEYDHLRDELFERGGGEPTPAQYAERWRMPERSGYRAFDEFSYVFPEIADSPGLLCDELWTGIKHQQPASHMMPLASVLVQER
jgi:hypothetical protein